MTRHTRPQLSLSLPMMAQTSVQTSNAINATKLRTKAMTKQPIILGLPPGPPKPPPCRAAKPTLLNITTNVTNVIPRPNAGTAILEAFRIIFSLRCGIAGYKKTENPQDGLSVYAIPQNRSRILLFPWTSARVSKLALISASRLRILSLNSAKSARIKACMP